MNDHEKPIVAVVATALSLLGHARRAVFEALAGQRRERCRAVKKWATPYPPPCGVGAD